MYVIHQMAPPEHTSTNIDFELKCTEMHLTAGLCPDAVGKLSTPRLSGPIAVKQAALWPMERVMGGEAGRKLGTKRRNEERKRRERETRREGRGIGEEDVRSGSTSLSICNCVLLLCDP